MGTTESSLWTWGQGEHASQTTTKDQNLSFYTRAARTSDLLDLLSHYHRTDGNGIHKLASDISRVKQRRLSEMTKYLPSELYGLCNFL